MKTLSELRFKLASTQQQKRRLDSIWESSAENPRLSLLDRICTLAGEIAEIEHAIDSGQYCADPDSGLRYHHNYSDPENQVITLIITCPTWESSVAIVGAIAEQVARDFESALGAPATIDRHGDEWSPTLANSADIRIGGMTIQILAECFTPEV